MSKPKNLDEPAFISQMRKREKLYLQLYRIATSSDLVSRSIICPDLQILQSVPPAIDACLDLINEVERLLALIATPEQIQDHRERRKHV